MDDLISRQAAIDAVIKRLQLDYEYAWGVREAINALPSAQQWIPCSESLPDEDHCTGKGVQYSADVLMTVYNVEDEETIIDYGYTVDGSWYSEIADCFVPSLWEVLAWMPLPEPYEGTEK